MHKVCLVTGMAIVIQAGSAQAQNARLIDEGRRIFFEETFGGNGRTCGTCHPLNNSLTISPEFLATLPPDDPAFVHEFNPALTGLEDARLFRERALVLENVNGFDEPPAFRGVPHILGLRLSKIPPPGLPVVDAVGWSADAGAPVTGRLRDVLITAITQHFPKTLARRACTPAESDAGVPDCDFRLPTDFELEAVEAFFLSLSRREVPAVLDATFSDPIAERGADLFSGVGVSRACTGCHVNAGALDPDGVNPNFDTGAEEFSIAPTLDDGFGAPGDGTFSMPSLIEAADTPPFFHSNTADTIEQAVTFYTTQAFADSPAGQFGGGFDLDPDEVVAVAAFLRAANAATQADNAAGFLQAARRPQARDRMLVLAQSDTGDCIEVLTTGPVNLGAEAIPLLTEVQIILGPLVGRAAQPGDDAIMARAGRLLRTASDLIMPDGVMQIAGGNVQP